MPVSDANASPREAGSDGQDVTDGHSIFEEVVEGRHVGGGDP
jgi:hypothetical protein